MRGGALNCRGDDHRGLSASPCFSLSFLFSNDNLLLAVGDSQAELSERVQSPSGGPRCMLGLIVVDRMGMATDALQRLKPVWKTHSALPRIFDFPSCCSATRVFFWFFHKNTRHVRLSPSLSLSPSSLSPPTPPSRLMLLRGAFVALAATLLSSVSAINPGFPYGSQKVRGVNLGGWLVL